MNDHELPSGHFELSQQELEGLMKSLAKELILHGEPSYNPNVWPETSDGRKPFLFSYPLPKSVMKEVFYPNDENLIVREGEAVYAAPHRIEPDDIVTIEGITIACSSRLAGTDIDCSELIFVGRDGSPYRGTVDTWYSREGRSIRPNDLLLDEGLSRELTDKMFAQLSDERIAGLIDDIFALHHRLTLDEVEKIRTIIDHIA